MLDCGAGQLSPELMLVNTALPQPPFYKTDEVALIYVLRAVCVISFTALNPSGIILSPDCDILRTGIGSHPPLAPDLLPVTL